MFSLEDKEVSGLFYKFCEDLIEQTKSINDISLGYITIVNRYFQWKKMFVSSKKHLLDETNIKGLIGEILFLKGNLADRIGLSCALKSWTGQELTHKDFSYGDNWFESKAISKNANSIKISSLEQLDSDKEGELVVDLDPGMAFGTGTHETTRMCIQALERYVKEESTVFDVGCGSGILAIAAAKLGAKLAVGVDLDPVAVESSIENVGYNKLNNIEILHGNLVEVIDGKADIVVANILAEIICILTDDVKRVLKDGGIFITSGIIHDRVDMVCEKLEATGFEVIEKNRDGEWNCIVAKLK